MSKEEKKNLKIRVFALIWSGILVLIIFPGLGTFGSLLIDSFLGIPTILPFPINIIIGIVILILGFF